MKKANFEKLAFVILFFIYKVSGSRFSFKTLDRNFLYRILIKSVCSLICMVIFKNQLIHLMPLVDCLSFLLKVPFLSFFFFPLNVLLNNLIDHCFLFIMICYFFFMNDLF